jgi:hypothetical protein
VSATVCPGSSTTVEKHWRDGCAPCPVCGHAIRVDEQLRIRPHLRRTPSQYLNRPSVAAA